MFRTVHGFVSKRLHFLPLLPRRRRMSLILVVVAELGHFKLVRSLGDLIVSTYTNRFSWCSSPLASQYSGLIVWCLILIITRFTATMFHVSFHSTSHRTVTCTWTTVIYLVRTEIVLILYMCGGWAFVSMIGHLSSNDAIGMSLSHLWNLLLIWKERWSLEDTWKSKTLYSYLDDILDQSPLLPRTF